MLLFYFFGGTFCIFNSNEYLVFGQLTQATLLHTSSALSHPEDLSISQPEGWMEKNCPFHFTGN